MWASVKGHTETLALLLANKADVHAADQVIIIIWMFRFYFTLKIGRNDLFNFGFTTRTH
jgi:hypothetical protein